MTDSLVMRSAREQLRGLETASSRPVNCSTPTSSDGTVQRHVERRRVPRREQGGRRGRGVDGAAAGAPCGPLAGLPMSIKDTHATAGLRNTYGSKLSPTTCPTPTTRSSRRLRAAGVVSIGKTNVPEFGAGSHTYNPVFGTTLNPYDPPAAPAAAAAAPPPPCPRASSRWPTAATWAVRSATRRLLQRGGVAADAGMAELYRIARDVGGQILGPWAGLIDPAQVGGDLVSRITLFGPALAIAGGSDQIQRNLSGGTGSRPPAVNS